MKNVALIILVSLMCLTLRPAVAANTPAPESLHSLDGYVQRIMNDWHVPGLALAVVQDGKVVLSRGYGVRQLGKSDKVDANTLFALGSNSKAFTAASLGKLVAEGKLAWDTPVIDVLPRFRLQDPWITRHLTLRDLLTHRSGYCDPTAAWYTSNAKNIVMRVRYQESTHEFRSDFCYNNVQYLVAGSFIPAITGQSWQQFVTANLFEPLHMDRTLADSAKLSTANNVATPHAFVDGKVAVISRYWPYNLDLFAAAGGIKSSANDMSHWLEMLLADGRFDGKVILSPEAVHAIEAPQILIPARGVGKEIRAWMPGGHFYTYGLGMFVQDYHDHKLVWHAGDIDGMASAVAIVPDARIGIVILSNMNGANARFAIIARILQTLLGQPISDLEPDLLAQAKAERSQIESLATRLSDTRTPVSSHPLPLRDYANTYSDQLDGVANVRFSQNHLILSLGNPDFQGVLEPWHGNTFRVAWRNRSYGYGYVTFHIDALGKPTDVSIESATLFGTKLHYCAFRACQPRVPVQASP